VAAVGSGASAGAALATGSGAEVDADDVSAVGADVSSVEVATFVAGAAVSVEADSGAGAASLAVGSSVAGGADSAGASSTFPPGRLKRSAIASCSIFPSRLPRLGMDIFPPSASRWLPAATAGATRASAIERTTVQGADRMPLRRGAAGRWRPACDGSLRRMYCQEAPEPWFEDFGKRRSRTAAPFASLGWRNQ
jgi:hypothetical protein